MLPARPLTACQVDVGRLGTTNAARPSSHAKPRAVLAAFAGLPPRAFSRAQTSPLPAPTRDHAARDLVHPDTEAEAIVRRVSSRIRGGRREAVRGAQREELVEKHTGAKLARCSAARRDDGVREEHVALRGGRRNQRSPDDAVVARPDGLILTGGRASTQLRHIPKPHYGAGEARRGEARPALNRIRSAMSQVPKE